MSASRFWTVTNPEILITTGGGGSGGGGGRDKPKKGKGGGWTGRRGGGWGRGGSGAPGPDGSDAQIVAQRWRVFFSLPESGQYIAGVEMEFRGEVDGADLTGSGTAYASSTIGGGNVSDIFDNNQGTIWASSEDAHPAWVEYDFGAGNDLVIAEIAFTSRDGASTVQAPVNMKIQVFFEGVGWITLSDDNQTPWSDFELRTSVVIQPTWVASVVRIIEASTYAITGAPASRVAMQEMSIYAILEV